MVAQGLDALTQAGLKPMIFSDVVADPPEDIVLGAVQEAVFP